MKKILFSVFMTVFMVMSSYAVNLSFGAKGMAGVAVGSSVENLGNDLTNISDTLKNKSEFLLNGGVYVDASLLGPLGVQVGANIGKNKVATLNGDTVVQEYSELLLDIPVMLWADLKLGPIGLGFGIGPNLSYSLNSEYSTVLGTIGSDNLKVNKAVVGVSAGANAKIFFKKKIALVAGASYILDLQKKEVAFSTEFAGKEITTDDLIGIKRSNLFGNIGIEVKLF